MRSSEQGGGTVEYGVLIVFIAMLFVVFGGFILKLRPQLLTDLLNLSLDLHLPEVVLIVAIAGSLFSALKWSTGRFYKNVEQQAKEDIIELLSRGIVLSKSEINGVLKRRRLWYKLLRDMPNDALLQLMESKIVQVDEEKYSLRCD
jgi:hypothetical protein